MRPPGVTEQSGRKRRRGSGEVRANHIGLLWRVVKIVFVLSALLVITLLIVQERTRDMRLRKTLIEQANTAADLYKSIDELETELGALLATERLEAKAAELGIVAGHSGNFKTIAVGAGE